MSRSWFCEHVCSCVITLYDFCAKKLKMLLMQDLKWEETLKGSGKKPSRSHKAEKLTLGIVLTS